jgi:hypothetical protein
MRVHLWKTNLRKCHIDGHGLIECAEESLEHRDAGLCAHHVVESPASQIVFVSALGGLSFSNIPIRKLGKTIRKLFVNNV